MNFLKIYNKKIIKYDLINKFVYKNCKTLPKLTSIILNFGCKNFNIKKFATTLLALEVLTLKKSTLSTQRKNINISLKIQKGQPAGCVITLRKKEIKIFLTKLHSEVLPKIKNFLGLKFQTKTSTFYFQLFNNELNVAEFEYHYPLFSNLPNLNVHVFTTAKNRRELLFLATSLKFPLFAAVKKILDKWPRGLRR